MIEHWTTEEFQEYLKNGRTPNRDRVANQDGHPKSTISHEPLAAIKDAAMDSPCRIVVYHYRTRLADVDNLQAKAFVDGMRYCGLLRDDKPEIVKGIEHVQLKVKTKDQEKTVVVIEELE